jgi:hypothetical protein
MTVMPTWIQLARALADDRDAENALGRGIEQELHESVDSSPRICPRALLR